MWEAMTPKNIAIEDRDLFERYAEIARSEGKTIDELTTEAVKRDVARRWFEKTKREAARPTLICAKTAIGRGAPTKANTAQNSATTAANQTPNQQPQQQASAPKTLPEAIKQQLPKPSTDGSTIPPQVAKN